MQRARSALIVVALSLPAWAGRAEPADMGGLCAPVEEHAVALERELQSCRARESAAADRAKSCGAKLEETRAAVADTRARLDGEHADRERLCAGAAELADGIVAGRIASDGVSACVPPETQGRLAQLLASWHTVTDQLAGLGAYLAGNSDALPRPSPLSATVAESSIARLLGSGRGASPMLYRRLLAQAVQQIAPQSWRRLRAAGPGAVDAWMASSGPLDGALADEARTRTATAQSGDAAASASTALELVRAYEAMTGCRDHAAARGCRRAAELRELLETSGPLVTRRRVQEIWAFDCAHVGPRTIAAWLDDVPGDRRLDLDEIADVAFTKLYTCFLDDAAGGDGFLAWLDQRLPGSEATTAALLPRVDRVRWPWRTNPSYERCARAVRALQELRTPASCSLPERTSASLAAWATDLARTTSHVAPALRACRTYVRAAWQGRAPTIASSFARPPAAQEIVVARDETHGSTIGQLRDACADRRGSLSSFAAQLRPLLGLAAAFGERLSAAPWHADATTLEPEEAARYRAAATGSGWLRHLALRQSACEAMGLAPDRCRLCDGRLDDDRFDCALWASLSASWRQRTERFAAVSGSLVALVFLALWAMRLRRALLRDGGWSRQTMLALSAIDVAARPSRLRILQPARWSTLAIRLPERAAWQRWGQRALALRVHSGARIRDVDVERAAEAAHRHGAGLALLVHDAGASPDLGAVRALLDWVARGGRRAVQVVPLSLDRMRWLRSADDLFDLVEQTSLRGNPFELRGRITHSSQFFDRERLVSGLLAGVQAGHWLIVTGLRRFGKSSLALEVARRLPGPSAYVDLAGFSYEIAHGDDPARAADAILGYLCQQLLDSARQRWPDAALPIAVPSTLGAAELTSWMRDFSSAARAAEAGRAPNSLLILDEIEQAIAVGPERLARALDVLSIVVGRLRSALADPAAPPGGGRVGLLLCSALHPLLWAPLATLAHQSLMGAFGSVCVPRLGDEAAAAMLRTLGAGHGVRFTDEALAVIVGGAQGVPLLVRRIASSVLELYDPERARQGTLGAVEIGVEGARAAIAREESPGSPLRVWIESEIAEAASPAGVILRRLAAEGRISAERLCATAQRVIAEQFAATGVDRTLPARETLRRTQEAASVMLRLIADTGMIVGHGNLTDPDAFELPPSALRAILAGG